MRGKKYQKNKTYRYKNVGKNNKVNPQVKSQSTRLVRLTLTWAHAANAMNLVS